MIGQTISHYKILEKLGGGGMGVVYKAEDTKLHRTVALKFLPPELTRDEEAKKRFIHEAQAASSLDHNNICAIHEVDETDDGQIFICMNYYDGETLKKKIDKGPLKLDEAIDITIQIAQGLLKAHEQKIIYRDVKPANVFLTNDGVAKVLDFGLAKLSTQSVLTKTGETSGTIAYMSPEQTRGEKIDHQTDIWSLGVVLYEMITGKMPFKGEYEQAMVYSILNDKPEPPTGIRTGVPMELERLINKALSKDPEERYQHIDEMLVDLRKVKTTKDISETTIVHPAQKKKSHKIIYWISGAVIIVASSIAIWLYLQQKSQSSEKSKFIAVLPFHPITNSEEDKSFAEGIHDDILTQLSKISELQVIARTSVLHYRNTQKTIKEIAGELGVGVVLEGSTRRNGNMIRITAQLIDAETEKHLWADTYDRPYNDIFAIQSDVAQKIASALQIKLAKEELRSIQTKPTENLQAWEYFQKGKYYWNFSISYEDNLKAAKMFEKACELDTNFGLSYAWQAIVYTVLYSQTLYLNKDTLLNRYNKAIARAIELAPQIPEINIARGKYFKIIKNDLNNAIKEIETANIKRPNDIDVIYQMSLLMNSKGDREEALKLAERVHELDPKGTLGAGLASMNSFGLERYVESERWADIMIANKPESFSGYSKKLNVILFVQGDLKRAEEVLNEAKKVVKIDKSTLIEYEFTIAMFNRDYNKALQINDSWDDWFRFLGRAMIFKILNKEEEAKINFDSLRIARIEIQTKQPDSRGYDPIVLAVAYAGLGDKKRSLNEIAKLDSAALLNSAYNIAYCHILLNDYKSAIQSLEKWTLKPTRPKIILLKFNPELDPLRSDPRFKKVIQLAEERIKRN